MTEPTPPTAPPSRFSLPRGPEPAETPSSPTWIAWTLWGANLAFTLAFTAIAPMLFGLIFVWMAHRLLRLPPPAIVGSDLWVIYLLGLILTPSAVLAVIGIVSLIGRAVRPPRKKQRAARSWSSRPPEERKKTASS